MSNGQVLDLIRAAGIPVGVLGVEYGWLFATGEESDRLFKVFREICENAVALGCKMLMSAPGQINGPIPQAIEYLEARRRHRRRVRAQARHRIQFAARRAQQPAGAMRADRRRRQAELRLSDRRLSLPAPGYGGASFKDLPDDKIYCFQYSDVSPNPVTGVRRPTDRLRARQGRRAMARSARAARRQGLHRLSLLRSAQSRAMGALALRCLPRRRGAHAAIVAGRRPRLCQRMIPKSLSSTRSGMGTGFRTRSCANELEVHHG